MLLDAVKTKIIIKAAASEWNLLFHYTNPSSARLISMMQAMNASRGYDHGDGIYRYRGAYTTTFSPWLYDVTQKAIRDCFMISQISKTFLLWLL